MLGFSAAVDDFDAALQKHVVANGWFREAPSKVDQSLTDPRRAAAAAGVSSA